jgi:hypothetical protein
VREYLYAWAAFGNKRLSEVTAALRVLTGVIAAAAVALAFGQYLAAFLPIPTVPVAVAVLLVMSAVNGWGIETSARVNLAFTAIEIAGLLFIIAIGVGTWGTVDITGFEGGTAGVLSATFLLFFRVHGVRVAGQPRRGDGDAVDDHPAGYRRLHRALDRRLRAGRPVRPRAGGLADARHVRRAARRRRPRGVGARAPSPPSSASRCSQRRTPC